MKKIICLLSILLILSILGNIILISKIKQPIIEDAKVTNKLKNYIYKASGTFIIYDKKDKESTDAIYKYYEDFSNNFYNIIERNAKHILDTYNIKERVTINSTDERNHSYTLKIFGNNQEELIEIGNSILKILSEKIITEYNYEMFIVDGISYSAITKNSNL